MPTIDIEDIPRALLRTYLQAARLPLRVAENVLKTDEAWPPTLFADAVEATVLQRVGELLRDEELIQQGRLVEAKVAQLRTAVDLEAEATARRTEAAAELREREAQAEEARERIEADAAKRERELAAEKARKKQQADERAQAKKAAAKKAEAAQEKAVERTERAAKKTRIAAERQALKEEREAAEAEQRVLDLDAAIDATKAARGA